MKNPWASFWMSAWMSAANAAAGRARGLGMAELKRRQAQMMKQGTDEALRFWTGGASSKGRKGRRSVAGGGRKVNGS